jgi:hypothetical protein
LKKYTPRRGSQVQRAVQYLTAHAPRGSDQWVRTSDLCAAIGMSQPSSSVLLRGARLSGLLVRRRCRDMSYEWQSGRGKFKPAAKKPAAMTAMPSPPPRWGRLRSWLHAVFA